MTTPSESANSGGYYGTLPVSLIFSGPQPNLSAIFQKNETTFMLKQRYG